jgi:polyisoprenoid-binding protein YceI
VDGNFTIRGVSNPEKLTLVVFRQEGHLTEIEGNMILKRKKYKMNKGIPFVKIGDHVEVNFHLMVRHSGGPPLALSGRNSS